MKKTRYPHECEACIFLGQHEEYDLYFCPQNGRQTVIARFGKLGDYLSGWEMSASPLVEARNRAERYISAVYVVNPDTAEQYNLYKQWFMGSLDSPTLPGSVFVGYASTDEKAEDMAKEEMEARGWISAQA